MVCQSQMSGKRFRKIAEFHAGENTPFYETLKNFLQLGTKWAARVRFSLNKNFLNFLIGRTADVLPPVLYYTYENN